MVALNKSMQGSRAAGRWWWKACRIEELEEGEAANRAASKGPVRLSESCHLLTNDHASRFLSARKVQ